ncbi:MAG: histidine kinase [Treponemataceae bacterium]|nr:histidine kinase [Treponemataceae bacterium]
MRHGKFSTQVAVVYTVIIAIPLFILIIGGSEYLSNSLIESLALEAQRTVRDQRIYMETMIDQMERLESVIGSDYTLLYFFLFSTAGDTTSIVETLLSHTKALERILFAQPMIYKVHLFIANPVIPERWPLVFREDRIKDQIMPRWVFNYENRIISDVALQIEPAVYLTSELQLNKRHVGTLQIGVRMADFAPFAYHYQAHKTLAGDFNTLSEGRTVVATGSNFFIPPAMLEQELLKYLQNVYPRDAAGYFRYRFRSNEYLVAFARIPRLDLTLIHYRSMKTIVASLTLIRLGASTILLASILLMFGFIHMATQRLFSRLFVIMNGLRAVRDGNLHISLSVEGQDEVAEMATIFTAMVAQINTLLEETRQEHELVAQTQIRAMQNQINAHFLYNALESIKMQAEVYNEADVVHSLTLLGRLMRYALRLRDSRVPLNQEIEYIQDYIQFLNIRNDYRITLVVDSLGPYQNLEIPKLLIQPIVENAVKHGIEPRGEDATISIAVIKKDPCVWIEVQDTGIGMSPQRLAAVRLALEKGCPMQDTAGGVGLQNIQERLWFFFGRDYRLEIESIPLVGTVVRIPLPVSNFKENIERIG